MEKAIWYKVEVGEGGTKEVQVEVEPKNGEVFTLEELQSFVEGNGSNTIQYLPLPSGKVMFANDLGVIVGLPLNVAASEYWLTEFPLDKYPHNNRGTIYGNVIVCTAKQAGDEDEVDS